MDQKRHGEIALMVVKCILRKNGIHLAQSTRELGNVAKEIGIPLEELKEFARPLVQELLDECFMPAKK